MVLRSLPNCLNYNEYNDYRVGWSCFIDNIGRLQTKIGFILDYTVVVNGWTELINSLARTRRSEKMQEDERTQTTTQTSFEPCSPGRGADATWPRAGLWCGGTDEVNTSGHRRRATRDATTVIPASYTAKAQILSLLSKLSAKISECSMMRQRHLTGQLQSV